MNISSEVKELRLLFEISRLFDGVSEVADKAGEILALMARYTGLAQGSLALLEADGQHISRYASTAARPEDLQRTGERLGRGLSGLVIESGRPMALARGSDEPFFLKAQGGPAKEFLSFLGVPVKTDTHTLGALSADRLFADSVPLSEDLRLLNNLAELIAQALEARQTLRAAPHPRAATLPETLEALEKRLIAEALTTAHGNMGQAAQALGVSERIMGLRMKKFGFDFRAFRKRYVQ